MRILRPLIPYLKRYRAGYIWGTVYLFINNAVWIMFPQVIRRAIDDLHTGVTRQKLLHVCFIAASIAAIKAVFQFLMRWVLIGVSREIEFDLRNDLFAQAGTPFLLLLSANSHRRHHGPRHQRSECGPHAAGAGHHVLGEYPRLHCRRAGVHDLDQPQADPVHFSAAAGGEHRDPVLRRSRFTSASNASRRCSPKSRPAPRRTFPGPALIRAYVQEEAEIAAFEKSNQEYIARSLKLVRLMGMFWPTLEIMLGFAMVLVLWLGGREVISHRISVGEFVAFNTTWCSSRFPSSHWAG